MPARPHIAPLTIDALSRAPQVAPPGSARTVARLPRPVSPRTPRLPSQAVVETSTVERDLRRFLAKNFPLGRNADSLGSGDSLLEAGVIDSTGVLELVGHLEDSYGIEVADEELVPENLDSIEHVVRYVETKLGST
ncbi:MAG: acyl carrier protein [Actinobacteria bacterium]|nr:acyl carrier protein [Actinomycetota bacterium]